MELGLGWLALIGFGIINGLLLAASALVFAERRVAGFIQERPGPNRVGPAGLLQPFADVLKLLLKEDIRPSAANAFLHSLAPWLMVVIAMTTVSVIPFWNGGVIADVDMGILVVLALTSISVYGITLGGWASNSKYSLLGGLRSSAQMISYELSMGAAVISVVLLAQSFNLTNIVEAQSFFFLPFTDIQIPIAWYIFLNPLGFIIFTVTAFAETNRAPFDLPEAEQELVGGYHTEYSGMKFGMFFLAEYVNMFIASMLIVTLFLGGYLIPFEALFRDWFIENDMIVVFSLVQFLFLMLKVSAVVFLFIWVRWTLPRFKYNQLMTIGWKYLLPLAFANIMLYAILLLFTG